MPTDLPLDQRIDLAEAFVELAWQRLLATAPLRRSGIIEEHRWRTAHAIEIDNVDWYLEGLSAMYAERDSQI